MDRYCFGWVSKGASWSSDFLGAFVSVIRIAMVPLAKMA
jgi:hypothetical protein